MREKRPGYWELRVFVGRHPVTNVALYRSKSVKGTKGQAEKAMARFITELEDSTAKKAVPGTVGQLLDQWLVHIELEGRSPTTMRGYKSQIAQLPEGFLRRQLRTVTATMLDDLYAHLMKKPGRGPSAVHHIHAMLKTAFKQAQRWELIDRNPALLATPPRVSSKEIEPPEGEAVKRVIIAAANSQNPENALIFRLLAATGCRRAEICGLRWSDFNFGQCKVTLRRSVVQVETDLIEKDTKTHQQRTVTLDPGTIKLLKIHHQAMIQQAQLFEVELAPDAYVFANSPDGLAPIAPDRLSQAWRRLADREGVDARLHDLRHLQASVLLNAGESITTVAARLGHRDTATTLRVYAHLMPGADERAADIVGDMLS